MGARVEGDVVFVFDENLIRLARGVMVLRRDVAVFGQDPVDRVLPTGALDVDWIPEVAARGWVVITNDRKMRTRPLEAETAQQCGLKVVHLHGRIGSALPWEQARLLMNRWHAVEEQMQKSVGPWWLSLESNRTRALGFAPGVPER